MAPSDLSSLDATPVAEAPATLEVGSEPYRPPVPTPTPSPLATWVQNLRPTDLLAGPAEDALRLTLLPAQSYLKVLEARAGWLLVAYGGDSDGHKPGNAWVRAADVGPASSPPKWVKNHRVTDLRSGPEPTAATLITLEQWSFLELMGQDQNGRLLVRYAGDGRARRPGLAWVEATDVGPVQPPEKSQLPRAYPAIAQPDAVRIQVPYRSQLDGTPWAEANCGPTTLGMALEALGINVSSTELRRQVLNVQQLWGNDVGSYIWALARVAEANGARTLDLYQKNGQLKHWSLGDVRDHLRAGHPVVVQAYFRALPGRQGSGYAGDHYIVLSGLVGDDFLYNDAINVDGLGYDRRLTPEQLRQVMDASDREYAYSAFALTK